MYTWSTIAFASAESALGSRRDDGYPRRSQGRGTLLTPVQMKDLSARSNAPGLIRSITHYDAVALIGILRTLPTLYPIIWRRLTRSFCASSGGRATTSRRGSRCWKPPMRWRRAHAHCNAAAKRSRQIAAFLFPGSPCRTRPISAPRQRPRPRRHCRRGRLRRRRNVTNALARTPGTSAREPALTAC
jgi:hypothetical protein